MMESWSAASRQSRMSAASRTLLLLLSIPLVQSWAPQQPRRPLQWAPQPPRRPLRWAPPRRPLRPLAASPDDAALVRVLDVLRDGEDAASDAYEEKRGCFVFEPPGGAPWGVVHFVGGAALGTYPHVAYGELLRRVVAETGVAVVATPFALSLDHETAAAECRAALDRCLGDWPPGLPVFGLGHSLGCKLLLLNEARAPRYERLVHVAANNFGIVDSARLLEVFLEGFEDGPAGDASPWGSIAEIVAAGAAMAGVEIAPSPEETLRRLDAVAAPCAFVAFDRDDLDCSASLAAALPRRANVAGLDGDHLTPVFVRVEGLDFAIGDSAAVAGVAKAVSDALTAIPEVKLLA